MKSTRLFVTLILLLIFFNYGWSQSIFREGYIIKKDGITLEGLVKYKSNQEIPSSCIFKRFDIAQEVKYSADDIAAFGYDNGNRFESKILNNKNQFLEVIVLGQITLYKKAGNYYIDKDHQGLTALRNGSIKYTADGAEKEFDSLPEFLYFITEGKAGQISSEFDIRKEITQLISSFNKASGKSYYVIKRSFSEKQLSQSVFESGVRRNTIGIIGGLDIYKLNITKIEVNRFLPKPGTEKGPVLGITYERSLSRRTKGLSLRIDALYTSQNFYSYSENRKVPGFITINDAFFKFSGLKLPILFQYSLTGHRVIPFLNAGGAYQAIFSKEYINTEEKEIIIFKEIQTTVHNDIDLLNYEFSGIFGFGVKIRMFNSINLNLQGRFEIGSGILSKSRIYTSDCVTPFSQNSIQSSILIGLNF